MYTLYSFEQKTLYTYNFQKKKSALWLIINVVCYAILYHITQYFYNLASIDGTCIIYVMGYLMLCSAIISMTNGEIGVYL